MLTAYVFCLAKSTDTMIIQLIKMELRGKYRISQKCDVLWQQPNICFLVVNNNETPKHYGKGYGNQSFVCGMGT